jgi:hypothetical protein
LPQQRAGGLRSSIGSGSGPVAGSGPHRQPNSPNAGRIPQPSANSPAASPVHVVRLRTGQTASPIAFNWSWTVRGQRSEEQPQVPSSPYRVRALGGAGGSAPLARSGTGRRVCGTRHLQVGWGGLDRWIWDVFHRSSRLRPLGTRSNKPPVDWRTDRRAAANSRWYPLPLEPSVRALQPSRR